MITVKGLKELEERVKDCGGKEVLTDDVGIDYCCLIRVYNKVVRCPYSGMVRLVRMEVNGRVKDIVAHVCLYHKNELG